MKKQAFLIQKRMGRTLPSLLIDMICSQLQMCKVYKYGQGTKFAQYKAMCKFTSMVKALNLLNIKLLNKKGELNTFHKNLFERELS